MLFTLKIKENLTLIDILAIVLLVLNQRWQRKKVFVLPSTDIHENIIELWFRMGG